MRGLTCQYSLACPAVDPDFMRCGALVRLLGWWLGLLALPTAAQSGPVVLRDTARDYPLGRYCAVLATSDAGVELTLEQVRSPLGPPLPAGHSGCALRAGRCRRPGQRRGAQRRRPPCACCASSRAERSKLPAPGAAV